MLDQTDISLLNFRFSPYIGTSLRDRLRDAVDMIRRPLYKIIYSKKVASLPYPVDWILPEKGMSTLARRQWVNQYVPLHNSRILVLGCGDAWDFGSYLRFNPREIVGVDLYNFTYCWQQVQDYVASAKLPTKITFHQVDIAQIDQAILGEFDVICSDAVFEHCQNLESVLKAMSSVIHPGGIIYASYGPLWYSWGGDHFSGRGGIEQGYNHLLLNPDTYQDYYHTHLQDDAFELQNGGRYIELDLFSKLSSQQYIELYERVGLKLKSLIVDVSKLAESLHSTPIFEQLLEKFPDLTIDDFLVRGHLVILEKL